MSGKGAANHSSTEKKTITISVEFVLIGNASPLSEEECLMLQRAAESVRTTARIVDTPCNEMNTDHFLQVRIQAILNLIVSQNQFSFV